MKKISDNRLVFIILGGLFIFFMILSFLSEGVYGGADNYVHYRIAKYAFGHPEFFLDAWGKPMFTIPASVFAQFGFNGIKIFNIVTGLAAAYFTFRTARALDYKFPLWSIIMLCAMPMYFVLMISSLTEIIFSFILIFSVWLFLEKRYYWYAAAISFLPFARTEGFLLLPFFALPLIREKKIPAILLLITGTVFFSLLGALHYRDLFWILNLMPYVGGINVYGSGDLFHFVNSYREITGMLPAILLITGIIALTIDSFGKNRTGFFAYEWMLVVIPFFIYTAIHSYLWWKGLGSSAGLTRVIAGVLPCAALLSLRGWNFIYQWMGRNRYIGIGVSSVLLFFLIREPFIRNRIPIPIGGTEKIVKQASLWLKQSKYYNRKIYYYDPTFCFFLDINPNDQSRTREQVYNPEQPEADVLAGEIVLWDAHFGPNEGHLPLERMTGNAHYILLNKFEPQESFQVLGGYNFAVYVFMRNAN